MNELSWQITESEYIERRCAQQANPARAKMLWTKMFEREYQRRSCRIFSTSKSQSPNRAIWELSGGAMALDVLRKKQKLSGR
jgi:hypothetical protein